MSHTRNIVTQSYNMVLLVAFLAFWTCAPRVTSGAVIAVEQFDYNQSSGTSISGANGGQGWSGAWGSGDNLFQLPGLTHPDLDVAGGRVQTVSGQTNFRNIDLTSVSSSLLDNGKLGANGSTIWLRMNFRMEGDNWNLTTAPGWGGLSLADGTSERLFMGKRNNQTRWGIERAGQGASGNLNLVTGSSQAWINLNIMMIVRLDFAAGSESLSAWWLTGAVPLDIDGLPDQSQLPTPSTMTIDDMRFNSIRIASGSNASVSIDEFFMATNFNDLFPGVIPEPGTMSLLLGGILVLRRLRMKKLI